MTASQSPVGPPPVCLDRVRAWWDAAASALAAGGHQDVADALGRLVPTTVFRERRAPDVTGPWAVLVAGVHADAAIVTRASDVIGQIVPFRSADGRPLTLHVWSTGTHAPEVAAR